MDLLEFICVMTVILVSGILIFVWISTKNAIKMQELAEKQRLSDIRRKAAATRYQEDQGDQVGSWISELMGEIGLDPSILLQDEMPAELKRFAPMIKGFIQGGGLQKILGKASSSQEIMAEDERAAI